MLVMLQMTEQINLKITEMWNGFAKIRKQINGPSLGCLYLNFYFEVSWDCYPSGRTGPDISNLYRSLYQGIWLKWIYVITCKISKILNKNQVVKATLIVPLIGTTGWITLQCSLMIIPEVHFYILKPLSDVTKVSRTNL